MFNLSVDEVALAVSDAGSVGLSQSATVSGGRVTLGGNGFVYLEGHASELPDISLA